VTETLPLFGLDADPPAKPARGKAKAKRAAARATAETAAPVAGAGRLTLADLEAKVVDKSSAERLSGAPSAACPTDTDPRVHGEHPRDVSRGAGGVAQPAKPRKDPALCAALLCQAKRATGCGAWCGPCGDRAREYGLGGLPAEAPVWGDSPEVRERIAATLRAAGMARVEYVKGGKNIVYWTTDFEALAAEEGRAARPCAWVAAGRGYAAPYYPQAWLNRPEPLPVAAIKDPALRKRIEAADAAGRHGSRVSLGPILGVEVEAAFREMVAAGLARNAWGVELAALCEGVGVERLCEVAERVLLDAARERCRCGVRVEGGEERSDDERATEGRREVDLQAPDGGAFDLYGRRGHGESRADGDGQLVPAERVGQPAGGVGVSEVVEGHGEVTDLCAAMAARRDPELGARFRAPVAGVRVEHGEAADEALGPDLLWVIEQDEGEEADDAEEEHGELPRDDACGGEHEHEKRDGGTAALRGAERGPGLQEENIGCEAAAQESAQVEPDPGGGGLRLVSSAEPWDPGLGAGSAPVAGVTAEGDALDACALRLVEACERGLSAGRGREPGAAAWRAAWRGFCSGLPGPGPGGGGALPDESTAHPVYWQESATRVRVGFHLEDVRSERWVKRKKKGSETA
jgi:hypothetical protein